MRGIYIIRNTSNNKVYVGQSIKPKGRLVKHKAALKRNNHENILLQRSWNKYGESCFEFYIISDDLTDQDCDNYEIKYIEWFQEINLCFNMIPGGYFNPICSTDTANRLRNANLGRKATDETRKKMSDAQKGRKRNPESTRKAIQTKKDRGYHHSQETIENIRKAKLGTKMSVEAKENMKKRPKKLRYFALISPTGEFKDGWSLPSFCLEHNLNYRSMCKVVNGSKKHYKLWRLSSII